MFIIWRIHFKNTLSEILSALTIKKHYNKQKQKQNPAPNGNLPFFQQ